MDALVDRLCLLLGYQRDNGLLSSDAFGQVPGLAQALWTAQDHAGVQACFGAWEGGWGNASARRFTPLVYIAVATDEKHAQQVHRWVWSQGKAPCLVIVCPDEVIVGSGFHYLGAERWNDTIQRAALPADGDAELVPLLRDLAADRLRASITWRDFTKSGRVGVDSALLEGLEALHGYLAGSIESHKLKVTPNLLNRLIGRLIYTYLLTDRQVVKPELWDDVAWDGAVERDEQALERQHERFWALQDRIDSIFNGGVFPISEHSRTLITPAILDLAIGFIRRGEKFDGKYRQSALFAIDLSAIRVETLSAVYEKFLRTESVEDANRDGVVYTRPFLVDFMVNRVADTCKLNAQTKVLDPTSGSGVFLVAAFRHIVESELATRRGPNRRYLPLTTLQALLTGCIHGVEKSNSAAEVAAFSLYLNLLDYLDPEALHERMGRGAADKVFPPLLGANIVVADFFSAQRFFPTVTFDVAVGNPPWKSLQDVTEHHNDVEPYEVEWHDASQHVAWAMVKRYLRPGGRLALVLPAKTFAARAAGRFITAFARDNDVDLVVNMSSWRRKLFEGAEDPAALLFATNQRPKAMSRTWFYMPRLWSQPFKPDAMWMLAVDRADVNSLPSTMAFADKESVFDAFVLKPYDRRVKQWLIDQYDGESTTSLVGLLGEIGLNLSRGVTASELGVKGAVLAASSHLEPDMRLHRRAVLTDVAPVLDAHPELKVLKSADLPRNSVGARCKGTRLVLARSMQYCYVTSNVFPVNTTFNVIFSNDDNLGRRVKDVRELLVRLGTFLMSDFARYQFALFGKLWQIDGKRAEKNDLEQIVVPSLSALRRHADWDCSGENTDKVLRQMHCEQFLDPLVDYVTHRSELENGRRPAARARSLVDVPKNYLAMLEDVVGSRLSEQVQARAGAVTSVMTEVVLTFSERLEPSAWEVLSDGQGFQFLDSAWLKRGANHSEVVICKPKGPEHMTIERAYSDGLHLINRLFLH